MDSGEFKKPRGNIMKKHLSIPATTSAAVLAFVLSASGAALAGPYAITADPVPYLGGVKQPLPYPPQPVKVGPCLVYQGDGQDDPSHGGSILIKCPANTVGYYYNFPNNELATTLHPYGDRTTNYISVGQDVVFTAGTNHFGNQLNPFSSTSATLVEYAIGHPPGFTPAVVTMPTPNARTVIVSWRARNCTFNVNGVYQKRTAYLDGGAFEVGGYVCGSAPYDTLPLPSPVEPSDPLPVLRSTE